MLVGHIDIAEYYCIAGWVADPAAPDRRITLEVLVGGEIVGRAVADRARPDLARHGGFGDGNHGFLHYFDRPLPMTRAFNIAVRDAATGALMPGGAFSLPPEPIAPVRGLPAVPTLTPVLVTSAGRSGSTLLMGRLRQHPDIIVADQPPFEMKQATYYAKAFDVLTSPGNRERSLAPEKIYDDPFTLGFNPYHHLDFESVFPDPGALYEFQRTTAASILAAAFADILNRFYVGLGAAQRKPGAGCFAEKCSIYDPTRAFVRAVAPGTKEIVLVRDPRDLFLSYRAFWHTTPEYTHQVLRSLRNALAAIAAAPSPLVLPVRYEDLVTDAAATMKRIGAFLGLDQGLTARGPGETALFAGHGTAGAPERSIGRWREELPAEEGVAMTHEFGNMLEAFGYER